MSHQSSSQIEINVKHIRECLVRGGLIPQRATTVKEDEEVIGARSTVTGSQLKHPFVENVVLRKKHIVEQLLGDETFVITEMFCLLSGTVEILHILRPLFLFSSTDPSASILEEFLSDLRAVWDKSLNCLDHKDSFIKAVQWLKEKISFAVWCLDQNFTRPSWSPKSILELSTQQPSSLITLKVLGGLQPIKQQEVTFLLCNQSKSMDVYKGFLALNSFLNYLCKHFWTPQSIKHTLEEVNSFIEDVSSKELCLNVLRDIFSLCFLRKEDILFEDTASDSGEERTLPTASIECSKSKISDPSCPSNSNSPSNTQTGTSSTALAGKKNDVSFGFLCQNPERLQASLLMLKRRLEALQVCYDEELLLQHRKLEQRVNQALWRLQIIEHDLTTSYFTRRSVQNYGHDIFVVRKAWLARLNPLVQTWYGYCPSRRKLRSPLSLKKKPDDEPVDPLLINRLLAEPLSLMSMSMMKSHLSAARQVADMYQLWETPEGCELHFSLAHKTAALELQRTARQVVQTSTENSSQKDACDSISRVRLPSAVETQLNSLQQATEPSLTTEDDWQSAVLVADLINSSILSPPERSALLNFTMRRIEGTVDLHVEPWRTLRRFTESSNYHLEETSWPSPIQSHLPFELQPLQDRITCLDCIRSKFKHLYEALSSSSETVETAFESLNQSMQSNNWTQSSTPLLRIRSYFELLKQLVPSRLKSDVAANLLNNDIGKLIVENLRDNPEGVIEMELITRSIGIELPSFLAGSLSSTFETSNLVDLTDTEFIGKLIMYLHSRCPLLAQVVELQLQTGHEVSFALKSAPSMEFSSTESMDVYRRYLKRSSNPKLKTSSNPVLKPTHRPSLVHLLSNSPLPGTGSHNSLLVESEEEPTARLGALVLEAIPTTMVNQLEHLLSQPLLIIEELLMNSQIGLASDLVKLLRLNGLDEDGDEINRLLLRYATKALALGLPETPSSTAGVRDKESGQKVVKKKKASAFVLPTTAPPKELWVADVDVKQCPCCQTIQFSMFDRRHHCRRCGRVVCAHCSPHRRLIDGYGDVPVRTCVDCYSTLQDRLDLTEVRCVRSLAQNGQLVWRLSLDAQHNQIARREFSYEHAPNLALALAMVHLSNCNETMANFLLDQSSSMLATLHRYLLHGTLIDVCSDPLMMFSLIKSLILRAKMRYSDIIAAPGQSKSKPSRGLARCDALLGQIDLLSLLASANCLHLLPPQPMSQLDTWRKLRDRLIEIELWSLALDVSTKAGLDAGSVWAAWGLICLKTGNFQGARQRFQRCLKPTKVSPLLQEILSVLESLSIPCASLPGNINESSAGSLWTSKRFRRLSSPSSQPSPVFNCDNPQLILASLTRLNDVCAGHLVELEDKNCILEEILFYLGTYGQPESPYAYLVERSSRIDLAVQRFLSSSRHQTIDVFNLGLLLPCLKSSKLEDLVIEMKRHDSSFHTWKAYLLAAAQLFESRYLWNSLYQLHCLSGDWIRACLVAIRRLYLNDLFSVETLVTRSHLLEDIEKHLNQYLSRHVPQQPDVETDKQLPLWWPANEVSALRKTIQLQMKVTAFLDTCLKEGKLSNSLLTVIKSVTQSSDKVCGQSNESNNSGVFLIPTLLGARKFCCSSAVLVTCVSPDVSSFELSWKICCDLRVRVDRFFRLTAFVLIRQGLVPALIQLVGFIKVRMTSQAVGFFDMDELLVECATLIQERDKESKSPELEQIIQQIKKPANKTRAFINLGWLKAAYLLAVKNTQINDVILIQQEANRLQQMAVLALCEKWLKAHVT